MALTANTWYRITVTGIANPPWTPGDYAASPVVVDAIASGVSFLAFCLSDGGTGTPAMFVTTSGVSTVPSDSISVVSTPSMDTSVLANGANWYSARSSTGHWLWYDDQSGIVSEMNSPTALGAFIS